MLQEKIGESSEVRSSREMDWELARNSKHWTTNFPAFKWKATKGLTNLGKSPVRACRASYSVCSRWVNCDGWWTLVSSRAKRRMEKSQKQSEELPLTLMGRILESDHHDAFSNSEKGELLETTMTTKNSNSKTVIFFLLQHPTTPFPY